MFKKHFRAAHRLAAARTKLGIDGPGSEHHGHPTTSLRPGLGTLVFIRIGLRAQIYEGVGGAAVQSGSRCALLSGSHVALTDTGDATEDCEPLLGVFR